MKSPIAVYKQVIKEVGVEDSENVSPVGKLTYIQEQVGQQKAILNRLLFDLTTSTLHQDEAKDDMTKDAHRKKADDYKNDIRQIHSSLKINLTLIEELRKEYPELQVAE